MLYVVLPVHNRERVTRRFLDSLIRQRGVEFHLVLVDDGCTDLTVEAARQAIPAERLQVLEGDGSLWWAGALELAYGHLTPRLKEDDAVLIINDDVTIEEDFLARGLQALLRNPRACIQAIGTDRASGDVDRGAIADLVRLRFRAAKQGEVPNCLSTRGLLMRADTFKTSGGFRPRYLPHYLSDYEFTLRLSRRGHPLLVAEDFAMDVDLRLSGFDSPSLDSLRQCWSDSFSNRAKFNPLHWTAFALLATPAWVAPLHVLRIWGGFLRRLARAAGKGHREQRT
jgi:GT2 family glycosyltransferase